MRFELHFHHRLLVVVLAIGLTAAALLFAVFIGGPIVRTLFGVPPGFHDHFTSREGFDQDFLAQSIAVGFTFFLLGAVLDTEYYGIHNGGLLAIVAPVVFAVCFGAGARASHRRLRGPSVAQRK